MQIIKEERIFVANWCSDPEEGALDQVKNLVQLPFAYHHVATMPDMHQGYGMPIGGILAAEEYIVPNAVGVDIGCGMNITKTSLTVINIDQVKQIMGEIRKVIPLGFLHHKERQDFELMPVNSKSENVPVCFKQYEKALYQIGTLGGGNHFIEIQKGDDGFIYIMIHLGSRNLGKQVADHYNKIAIELNRKYHSIVPKEWELAYLPFDSDEGHKYFREMKYCVDFAKANRQLMMNRIVEIFVKIIPETNINFEYDIAHNYARLENHYNKNVWIHRKGATSAQIGELGIIPGSQGTSSYLVKGKGNPLSFTSCSHGAGRKMGRKQAERILSLEEEIKKLDNLGIIHSIRTKADLDEAPGAYKDIDIVMNEQSDLVEILVKLTPIAVIKDDQHNARRQNKNSSQLRND